ncbi:uncharacterized protein LOC130945594 [Arachis stenosperma]|uniref:uncharacterized protein LOC130945594 n=1 Tax=Arachis stenosperma TaxID=217475 RepID=UPI0025ABCE26|nr:uncharacterized protein LOC130945594 [Arachis stenosperma]
MSLSFPSLPFRSAARDCVSQERNSFVNFQAKTGVEAPIVNSQTLEEVGRLKKMQVATHLGELLDGDRSGGSWILLGVFCLFCLYISHFCILSLPRGLYMREQNLYKLSLLSGFCISVYD